MISATASPSGAGSAAALDRALLGTEPTTAGASRRSVPARAPSRVAVFAARSGTGAAISITAKKTSATSSSRTTQTRTSSGAGYASKTTAAKGELAFLSDKKLSTEEKLFRFMAYMASKYDAEIEQKMKEVGGDSKTGATSSTGSSSAPKKKGLFGGLLGKVAKAAFPAAAISLDLLKTKEVQGMLKTVSGPVLAAAATALGAPQLAPVLLKVGPGAADVLIGVAKSIDLDGAPAAPASSGSGASKASSASTASSASKASGTTAKNEQLQMMELQRLYEKQKEMMSLASNMLKGLHDMRMVAINNIGR